MSCQGIAWKPVLAYASMSNGKAERMVGTIKRSIRKTLLGHGAATCKWESALKQILYGYRRRRLSEGFTLFALMYGVKPPSQNQIDPNQIR